MIIFLLLLIIASALKQIYSAMTYKHNPQSKDLLSMHLGKRGESVHNKNDERNQTSASEFVNIEMTEKNETDENYLIDNNSQLYRQQILKPRLLTSILRSNSLISSTPKTHKRVHIQGFFNDCFEQS
ncbi:unnamed protein product [Didymodactylos carnosus]|uniref:Uncharacterized protein n=1 Tax=Didymodactylos carnosus TaxID=1234261 RepID=A0A814CLN5_9BILA|nr:unnamed protein product [Didymodactylos carnosus]CAF3718861.1 unnamed protein product [Didymodactylos carnosus]